MTTRPRMTKSPVTTLSVDSVEKTGFLFFFSKTVFVSDLNEGTSGRVLPFHRLFDLKNFIKLIDFLEAHVDVVPGAGDVLADLTAGFIGAAAWAVEQAFGAARDRTDAARIGQDAVPAPPADFRPAGGG